MWFHPDSVGLVSLNYNAYDTLVWGDSNSVGEARVLPSRGLMACKRNKSEEEIKASLYIGADGNLRYMGKQVSYHEDSLFALFSMIDSNLAIIKSMNEDTNANTADETELDYIYIHMPPLYGNKNETMVLKWYYALNMLNPNNTRYYYVIM